LARQGNYITDFALDEIKYIIGPGDLFEIYIEKNKYIKEVNPEGKILLKKIGEINVNNFTLKEAKAEIIYRIKKYNNIARSYVNLFLPKKIRVFITGAVSKPGIYEVAANHRLTDVLTRAKWFRTDARKSLITITPKNGKSISINIGKFLVNGELESNPYIGQGFVIHVPFVDYTENTVTIRYKDWNVDVQVEDSETIADVILKFNSYQYAPPKNPIEIILRKG